MKYKIKETRKSKGLTQKQLGDRLGVSASAVSQFESENANIKTDTLEKIAAALECDLFELISFEDYAKSSMKELYEAKEQYIEKLAECARLLNHVGQIALYKIALQMSYDPDYTEIDETKLLKEWGFLPEDVLEYGNQTKEES